LPGSTTTAKDSASKSLNQPSGDTIPPTKTETVDPPATPAKNLAPDSVVQPGDGELKAMPIPALNSQPKVRWYRTHSKPIIRAFPADQPNLEETVRSKEKLDFLIRTEGEDSPLVADRCVEIINKYALERLVPFLDETIELLVRIYPKQSVSNQQYLAGRIIDGCQEILRSRKANETAPGPDVLSTMVAKAAITEQWLGDDDLPQKFNMLGTSYERRGKHLQAALSLQAASALLDRRSAGAPATAISHRELGNAFISLHNYADAERHLKLAVNAQKESLGLRSEDTFKSYCALATLFASLDRRKELLDILPSLMESARAAEHKTGDGCESTMSELLDHGFTAESEELALAILQSAQKYKKENFYRNLSGSLNGWARQIASRGDADSGRRLYLAWVEAEKQLSPSEMPHVGDAYLLATQYFAERGDRKTAVVMAQLAYHESHSVASQINYNIGQRFGIPARALRNEGMYKEAELLYQRAVELSPAYDKASMEIELIETYIATNQLKQARKTSTDAVADSFYSLAHKLDDQDEEEIADMIDHYFATWDYAELKIFLTTFSRPTAFNTVGFRGMIAQFYEQKKEYRAAVRLLKKEIDERETLKVRWPMMRELYRRYAAALREAGSPEEAGVWQEKADHMQPLSTNIFPLLLEPPATAAPGPVPVTTPASSAKR
jgi:tetratricopeptide (TPR) repeat protein